MNVLSLLEREKIKTDLNLITMVKLAFIITAHNDPVHLKRLTDVLPESAEFFVHIDAKSDLDVFTSTIDNPRVHFTRKRVNVMWGSIGVVDSQMELIKDVLDSNTNFDYLISMSGLDYPLWSNEKILTFFEEHKGTEFIYGVLMENQGKESTNYREHRPFNYKFWKYGTLKSKFRVSLRHIIYTLGIRKQLHFNAKGKRYDLYKGAMWWAISPELAKVAYNNWADNPEFYHYFHDSFAPDETFIPTTAFNDEHFKSKTLGTKEKFTKLEDVTPLTFIDYTHGIKILDESDLSRLLASGKMFCRKTITGESDKLMDMIDTLRVKG